jgi:hypothetical protein
VTSEALGNIRIGRGSIVPGLVPPIAIHQKRETATLMRRLSATVPLRWQ